MLNVGYVMLYIMLFYVICYNLHRCGDKQNIKILKRRGLGDKTRPTCLTNIVYKAVLTT